MGASIINRSQSKAIRFSMLSVLLTMTLACILLGVLAQFLLVPAHSPPLSESWDMSRVIMSQTAINTIASATSITAYEVTPTPGKGFNRDPKSDHRVLPNSRTVDEEMTQWLAAALSELGRQKRLYLRSFSPPYDLKLEFKDNSSTVIVYVSTTASMFEVYEEGEPVGGWSEGENFLGLARTVLTKLRHKTFREARQAEQESEALQENSQGN